MAEFYMMVGLPGSGKSFLAKNMMNCEHISSDAIREEVFGDVNDQNHNDEVFNIMLNRTIEVLKNDGKCVYDATNLNAKRRMNLLKELRNRVGNKFHAECIVCVPSFELCCKRNNERDRVVPQFVMDRMYKQFQPPIYEEGWDEIVVYGERKYNRQYLLDLLEKSRSIPHDNPNHKLSIGEHMLAAETKAIELGYGSDIREAALFHDIGKSFCKVFTNMKGEPTEYAHYYGHSCVSAYLYYQCCAGFRLGLYDSTIIGLIGYHMEHFAGEKRINNMRKMFGSVFMEKLEKLHRCDKEAH